MHYLGGLMAARALPADVQRLIYGIPHDTPVPGAATPRDPVRILLQCCTSEVHDAILAGYQGA